MVPSSWPQVIIPLPVTYMWDFTYTCTFLPLFVHRCSRIRLCVPLISSVCFVWLNLQTWGILVLIIIYGTWGTPSSILTSCQALTFLWRVPGGKRSVSLEQAHCWQRLSTLFSVSLLMGLCKHRRPLAPLSLDSGLPPLTYSPNYPPEAWEEL